MRFWIFIFVLIPSLCFGALSTEIQWEVRTTGSDNNGGGFRAGASGTDRSQQDAAHVSGTNLTVDGTDNTLVVPDGHTPVAADVGNVIQITAGAGFTTGFYEIIGQDGTNWDLDRSPAAVSTSGGTWAMGGALLTIGKAYVTAAVEENTVWVKKGTGYSISTAIDRAAGGNNWDKPTRLLGYETTRGDAGRPVVTQTGSSIDMIIMRETGSHIANFELDGNDLADDGLLVIASYASVANVKVIDCNGNGISASAVIGGSITGCEVSGCSGAAGLSLPGASGYGWNISNCWIHDNNVPGISVSNGATITHCRITKNTGATSHGIVINNTTNMVQFNTVHGNGGDGIRVVGTVASTTFVRNNIITSNTGTGLLHTTTITNPRYIRAVDYNAFRANGTTRSNIAAGDNDITLTADPYTDATNNDFTLNSTAGGGALCKGASAISANLDIGALQSASSAGPTPKVHGVSGQ